MGPAVILFFLSTSLSLNSIKKSRRLSSSVQLSSGSSSLQVQFMLINLTRKAFASCFLFEWLPACMVGRIQALFSR